ncbi:MAG: DUF3592 domain-containing protein [Chthoniobacteraceae bacterium]
MAKSSPGRQLPRGCAWPCLAIGVPLALLGLGSLLGLPKCWVRSRKMWAEVPGAVTESDLKEGQRKLRIQSTLHPRSSEAVYIVRLKYRYRVDGRDFTGEVNAPRQPKNDSRRDEAQAVAETYRAGDAVAVFCDPADATGSRLTQKEPGIEFGKDVLFTLLFLSGGGAALYVVRAILRPRQRAAPS